MQSDKRFAEGHSRVGPFQALVISIAAKPIIPWLTETSQNVDKTE